VFISTIVFFETASKHSGISRLVTSLGHIWGYTSVGLLMSHDALSWPSEMFRLLFLSCTSLVWYLPNDHQLLTNDITSTFVTSLCDYLSFWPVVCRQALIGIVIASVIYWAIIGRYEQRAFIDGVRAAAAARAKAKAEKAK
jgi:hypothetical protein